MKKLAIGIALLAATVGIASAQGFGGGPMMGRGYPYQAAPGAVQAAPTAKTIEGKLVFVDGVPALQAKDKTYLVHLPRFYYYAYTDGIKEGAAIKLDGYELPTVPGQDKPYFQATKAVIAGKTYDFTTQGFGRMGGGGCGFGGGAMGGRGGMMGGRGGRW